MSSESVSCWTAVLALVLGAGVAYAHGKGTSAQAVYDVRAFGAKGDGTANDTPFVQRAVDACAKAGGGTVLFRAGTYVAGSIHLRSQTTLRLEAGAVIQGSKNDDDYDPYETLSFPNAADRETSFFHQALIWGEDIEQVAIVGAGAIDSNRERRGGPKAIALKRCRFVEISGIRILNAPNYAISLLGTDSVNIDGVTILNAYADGIDPDACRNVRISNCHIESRDDAIVPKSSYSLGERRSTENITVTNCYLATTCNGFKLGTESGGDFKRIAVSNCVISGLAEDDPAAGGISLESVDGAHIDGVVVSNITMVGVRAPIFIRLGNRGRDLPTPVPGSLKSVIISNVTATNASYPCTVTGIPGHCVENVSLSDIQISYSGGGPFRPLNEPVPELEGAYPDPQMFEALPTYGLYCRHAVGVTLSKLRLGAAAGYWRLAPIKDRDIQWVTPAGPPSPSQPAPPGPALVCDDVADLTVDGLGAQASPDGSPVLHLTNVQDAMIRGTRAPAAGQVFLEVAGTDSKGVYLVGNVLGEAVRTVKLAQGVNPHAVVVQGNAGADESAPRRP